MSDKPPVKNTRPYLWTNILPKMIAAAREHGYALAVHGSMLTDLDLVAVPWVETASGDRELAEALAVACEGHVPMDAAKFVGEKWVSVEYPRPAPHGRRCWSINWGGDLYIDLSVMPLNKNAQGI